MAVKYMTLARKLQSACLLKGEKILFNSRQWYNEDRHRAVTQYIILKSTEENGKEINRELFKTYSQIQLVLFMRDYWYTLNGWELPADNPEWEEIKTNVL